MISFLTTLSMCFCRPRANFKRWLVADCVQFRCDKQQRVCVFFNQNLWFKRFYFPQKTGICSTHVEENTAWKQLAIPAIASLVTSAAG